MYYRRGGAREGPERGKFLVYGLKLTGKVAASAVETNCSSAWTGAAFPAMSVACAFNFFCSDFAKNAACTRFREQVH